MWLLILLLCPVSWPFVLIWLLASQRRAARRSADALERIASTIDPPKPRATARQWLDATLYILFFAIVGLVLVFYQNKG